MRSTRIRIPVLLALTAALSFPTAVCAEIFRASSSAEAQRAIDRAKPGDEIALRDGIHTDFQVVLRGKGTDGNPIVLRAATPGKAILTGKVSIRIQGEGLVVRDMVFDQAWGGTAVLFDRATRCLLTDCAFIECGDPRSTARHIVSFRNHSHHNVVERCLMQGNLSMGVGVSISKNNFSNTHNRIAWNYFKDIKRRSGNGQEAVQLGQSTPADHTAQHALVEHNLFERANGDAEIISNKSSYNILRYNTVRDCSAMLVLRRGYHTRVEGNYFFGGSGGIRAYGGFHQILNNYIEGGSTGIYIPSGGVWNTGALGYPPFTCGVVAYNTIVNCRKAGIHVGEPNTHPMTTIRLPLIENDFIGNLVVGREGELIRHDGSINSTWRGNLVYATGAAKPGYSSPGIQIADPKLEQRDGIWRLPTTGSPAIDPPSVNYNNVNAPPPGSATDIDGQPRDGKPDTGCDEAAAGPVRYPPLQPKDVGPAWMAGDPARLGRIPAPKPIPRIKKARKAGK